MYKSKNKTSTGSACWLELHSQEVINLADFYKNLFGWELLSPPEMQEKYAFFTLHGIPVAGLVKSNICIEKQPIWISYYAVNDIAATIAHAVSLNGKIHLGPIESQGNKVAIIEDITGGLVGLFEHKSL